MPTARLFVESSLGSFCSLRSPTRDFRFAAQRHLCAAHSVGYRTFTDRRNFHLHQTEHPNAARLVALSLLTTQMPVAALIRKAIGLTPVEVRLPKLYTD